MHLYRWHQCWCYSISWVFTLVYWYIGRPKLTSSCDCGGLLCKFSTALLHWDYSQRNRGRRLYLRTYFQCSGVCYFFICLSVEAVNGNPVALISRYCFMHLWRWYSASAIFYRWRMFLVYCIGRPSRLLLLLRWHIL